MPKRRRRKTKVKKRTRKMVKRRKAVKRRKRKSTGKLATRSETMQRNKKAHWMAYRELQIKADKAWAKLRADVKRKAKPEVLLKDRNALALLLGECNYMTRECMSFESHSKKR